MKTAIISIIEVELIAYRLADKLMKFDEPIPDFGTRFPSILESCIATPFQEFGGKFLYEGLVKKAAVLFYLMIKNHPFKNGNKRIAMMSMLYLLHKNGKWIESDNQVLYNFAKWVASSDPSVRDATVSAIEKFLSDHLSDLEP
ncbi:MAG TPA: type II toxin-antitoxin system death-on-curing family toxin [Candidatus Paceibacterota bacterium]|nr:type II toxin-antitoxin system death-on-curing family toxin [Candidatus Paceibacterota bacterium]